MGSKGSNTTTTQTSANPAAMDAYYSLLNRAGGVASTPYQAYQGDLTAPINAQQTTGINNINQGAGFAQPYIQSAAGYANSAAQPLSQADIARYQSPYTQSVVDSTSAWFNNQNKQQQQNVLGNAAAQGALGGDRVGVAQANLAAQQTASQAPVIAGLYNQGYQQAVGVAQQQQQNRANAAYSLGNLGVAGQNAALTGANAQVGAGSLQQQNEQQRLNAAYQQYQIGQAFPYQQTQWLAGIDTGVGSQLGGNSSTTAPAPNPWAQYAGVGLTAASMFLKQGGGVPGFAPGGQVDDAPFGGVGWIPGRSITMGRGAPPPPGIAKQPDGTADLSKGMNAFAKAANRPEGVGAPMDLSASGVAGFSPSYAGMTYSPGQFDMASAGLGGIYRDGGRIPGFANGGARIWDTDPRELTVRSESTEYERARRGADAAARSPSWVGRAIWPEEMAIRDGRRRPFEDRMQATGGYSNGGQIPGFAPGGDVGTFDDRWSPAIGAVSDGTFDPQGLNARADNFDIKPTVSDAGVIPVRTTSIPRPQTQVAGFAPQYNDARDDAIADARDTPDQPALGFAPDQQPTDQLPGSEGALPFATIPDLPRPDPSTFETPQEQKRSGFNLGILPDNLRMPLLTAGLAMLASKSPNLGNAIGEGGLAGVGAYAQQKQAELTHAEKKQTIANQSRHLDNEAKRLDNAAEQSRKALAEHTRHNVATEGRENLTPVGTNEDGFPVYLDRRSGKEVVGTQKLQGKDNLKPSGTTTEEGHPILYDTKKPGVAIDAITGERIAPEQKVVSAKPDGKMSEAATEIAARQVANGDLSGLTNVGRGAQGDAKLTAIKNKGAEILMSEMGMSPKEAAKYMSDKVQEFKAAGIGKSAAARTGATREENLNIILRATEAAIPAALEASKNVYRTGWVPINQLIQKGQVIANNPELREWGMANLQLAEHWARAMNPTGVMRESDRDKALEFLSTTDGPQTYERAVRQLEKQIIREKNAVGKHVEPTPGGSAPSEMSQDKQAIDWANANPSDPRSAAIKKRLGVP